MTRYTIIRNYKDNNNLSLGLANDFRTARTIALKQARTVILERIKNNNDAFNVTGISIYKVDDFKDIKDFTKQDLAEIWYMELRENILANMMFIFPYSFKLKYIFKNYEKQICTKDNLEEIKMYSRIKARKILKQRLDNAITSTKDIIGMVIEVYFFDKRADTYHWESVWSMNLEEDTAPIHRIFIEEEE